MGGGIDDNNKIFPWMEQTTWLNLKALSRHKFANEHSMFFKELQDKIQRNDQIWRAWIEENEPESTAIPDYEDKINADQNIGHFIHLCLVRAMRRDRTMLASEQFIQAVLGEEYVLPVTDLIPEIYAETSYNVPVLYLLSAGADPTGPIDDYARKHKQFPTLKVSMGEA
jgi:dynein heavy chain